MSASFSSRLSHAKRLHASGKLREAEAAFSQILKDFGAESTAVARLADAALDMGEAEAAISLYRRAVNLAPDNARLLGQLGMLLGRTGQKDEATSYLRKAVTFSPCDARLQYNLGKVLSEGGLTAQAIEAYERAATLDPKFTWTFTNLGNALADLGRHDEAAEAYRRSLELDPDNANCWSNFLLSSQYAEGVTAARLFELSQGFEKHVGAVLRKQGKPLASRPDPDRPLRIGYVSPDFKRHPVGYFMQGVFAHHDPSNFNIYAYSCHLKEDDLTARLKQHASEWVAAFLLDDKQLAQRIRADKIDILVDLSGHTSNNRLPVFARKPAPLQLTWAGYVGTTGLDAIDGLIADRWYVPKEEEIFYAERVLRLPGAYVCYAPPDYAPQPSSAPFTTKRHVTFGCFNNPAKISESAMKLWARILDAVKDARLVVIAALFKSEEQIEAYRQRFIRAGVDAGRLELKMALPHRELLEAYNSIDIALDPFPYSGGLTTAEALWMGVPVVTLTGSTFAGRHSTSYLGILGLNELVAASAEDYFKIASALAKDKERILSYKSSLRARMLASPLLDHADFTRNYEAMLREIWREWCAEAKIGFRQ